MNTAFEYRAYVVSHDGDAYTAAPVDEEPYQLRSKTLLRVTRAIDTLWNALEKKIPLPSWLLDHSDLVDLDAASEVRLIVSDRKSLVPSFSVAPAVGVPSSAVA